MSGLGLYEEKEPEELLWEEYSKQEEGQQKVAKIGIFSFISALFLWILPVIIAFLFSVFLKSCIILNATVPSGSMENTIRTGDSLIGLRVAYAYSGPERGDIIIFRYPDDPSEIYIKRLIGLPGETVVIEDGQVYIDGSLLEEDYLKEEWTRGTGPYEFAVPAGCYLVLGDNRNDSKDARYWDNAYVKESDILAKAVFIYSTFSDMKWL